MSDNSNSVGCWGWLQYVWEWLESIWQFIMFIVFGYSIVIRILAAILKVKLEELPDWALVVGLLFSIPAVLLASKLLDGFLSILKTIFTWLGTILIGTLLLIVFVYLHLSRYIEEFLEGFRGGEVIEVYVDELK